MSKETFDPTIYNPGTNQSISTVLEMELSRRGILKRTAVVSAFAALASAGLTGCRNDETTPEKPGLTLGFKPIPGAKEDAVVVPEGYKAEILAPWGTPINDQANAWQNDGSNTSLDQLNALGMHHDGMHFFPLNNDTNEGLLCINHEYIDQNALHPNGATKGIRPAEEVRKEINAHGVSVIHIKVINNQWELVTDSRYNRRITSATEIDVAGPIADSPLNLLATRYTTAKNNAKIARGTNNNCGNGYTPWGTYLTCEENWPGYFTRNDGAPLPDQKRLGISTDGTRYGWETPTNDNGEFSRFNITPSGKEASEDFRNEANGHGYIVEVDPYEPSRKAIKRTALGRFRHEDCTVGKVAANKPVVFYSGHDGRFEYIYKFVSEALWDPADSNPEDRLATGSKYMDKGTLYVAQFNAAGVGKWLALTPDSTTRDNRRLGDTPGFTTLAEVLLNTPGAADLMGATPMDRPEWTAVDPTNGTVYVTLTNNTKRNNSDDDPKNDTNIANPRDNNKFGHIIRWRESADQQSFNWEFFLFGAPAASSSDINRSALDASNELASPDGLAFDPRGILWIQTDNGADEVEENTNDQMLAIIPSQLQQANGNEPVVNAGTQGQLRRFFVGPNGSEVTGLAFSPDYTSLFVNIQHPRNWPAFKDATAKTVGNVRPRSSTVVIRRIDGGKIGV